MPIITVLYVLLSRVSVKLLVLLDGCGAEDDELGREVGGVNELSGQMETRLPPSAIQFVAY